MILILRPESSGKKISADEMSKLGNGWSRFCFSWMPKTIFFRLAMVNLWAMFLFSIKGILPCCRKHTISVDWINVFHQTRVLSQSCIPCLPKLNASIPPPLKKSYKPKYESKRSIITNVIWAMMDTAMLISKTSVGGTFYTRLSLATKSKRYDSVNLMEVPNDGPILRFSKKRIYLEAKKYQ